MSQSDWFNLYLLLVCLGAPPSAWEADTSPPWQGSGEDRPRQRKKAEQAETGADGAGERKDVQAKKTKQKKACSGDETEELLETAAADLTSKMTRTVLVKVVLNVAERE